mmetsp:Transcript_14199/g.36086  ORF Transcript_14199/g.36086 Transcript_14199/m.36086 type:complete len:407 (+) Transcript_14199:2090-3310(+)
MHLNQANHFAQLVTQATALALDPLLHGAQIRVLCAALLPGPLARGMHPLRRDHPRAGDARARSLARRRSVRDRPPRASPPLPWRRTSANGRHRAGRLLWRHGAGGASLSRRVGRRDQPGQRRHAARDARAAAGRAHGGAELLCGHAAARLARVPAAVFRGRLSATAATGTGLPPLLVAAAAGGRHRHRSGAQRRSANLRAPPTSRGSMADGAQERRQAVPQHAEGPHRRPGGSPVRRAQDADQRATPQRSRRTPLQEPRSQQLRLGRCTTGRLRALQHRRVGGDHRALLRRPEPHLRRPRRARRAALRPPHRRVRRQPRRSHGRRRHRRPHRQAPARPDPRPPRGVREVRGCVRAHRGWRHLWLGARRQPSGLPPLLRRSRPATRAEGRPLRRVRPQGWAGGPATA